MLGPSRYDGLQFGDDEGYSNQEYTEVASNFCKEPTLISMINFLHAQNNISKDLINSVVTTSTIEDGSFENDSRYKVWVAARLNYDSWANSLYRVFYATEEDKKDLTVTAEDYANCISALKAAENCLKIYFEETYEEIPLVTKEQCIASDMEKVKTFVQTQITSISDKKDRLNGIS